MTEFEAPNSDYARHVRALLQSIPLVKFIGAELVTVAPGVAEVVLPYRAEMSHIDGGFPSALIGALSDIAGVAAASTLLRPGWILRTFDFNVKVVASASGGDLLARGRVIRPGNTISVTGVTIYAGKPRVLCATAFVTTRNFRSGSSK